MSCSHCYFFLSLLSQIMSATWRQKSKAGEKKEKRTKWEKAMLTRKTGERGRFDRRIRVVAVPVRCLRLAVSPDGTSLFCQAGI